MGDLLELAVYNPAILDDASFLNGFAARQDLAERLLQRLGETTADGLATHHLILGQRGMGKTSLLRRLALGVRDDPRLAAVLLPLSFREEQYNVHNLHVLWLNCLDALGDWFERTGQPARAAALDRDVARLAQGPADDPEGTAALETFQRWTRELGRRPLLLLDNLDIILNGLAKQQWSLRGALQRPGGIVVVGASAGWLEATEEKNAAFYDFFQVTVLEPLGADELIRCLGRLASLRGEPGRAVQALLATDPGRIRALHDLTGGNPRTLTLLYLLLETDTGGDVLTDLERLLDQVSVLYKARVEDLAPQSRVVLDAVALAWDPVIAAEVAAAAGLATGTVSAQLTRLERDGIVQRVSVSRSNRDAYQLAERFFNIWYLMRHGPRRQRARLRWLSAFLRGFYTPAQLRDRALDLLNSSDAGGFSRGQYLLALSDAVDEPAWRRALAVEAERVFAYLARSGKRPEDIGDLSDLPRPETAEEWEAKIAYTTAQALDPEDLTTASNLLAIVLLRDDIAPVDDAAFNAIVGRHPDSGANLLRALRALVRGDLSAAADAFAAVLSQPDGDVLTMYQGFVLLFLREAARRGHGDALLSDLRDRGIADTHWPLVAAYEAYLHGETRLADVNPEVRRAARRIYDSLDAPRRSEPPAPRR